MKQYAALLIIWLLIGCSGVKKSVENPYLERFHLLSGEGVIAMQHERWQFAERAFERALTAAQLADEPSLQTKAMYNLAMTRLNMDKEREAERTLLQSLELAERYGDKNTAMRSRLALALMQVGAEQGAKPFENWPQAGFPADIYLSAARLAQHQQDSDTARAAYQRVIQMRGESTSLISYRAQSYLGLAMLSRAEGEDAKAEKYAHKALKTCRIIGLPRISAHTLMLLADLKVSPDEQKVFLERALVIYQALKDTKGQKVALTKLVHVSETLKQLESSNRYKSQLKSLSDSEILMR